MRLRRLPWAGGPLAIVSDAGFSVDFFLLVRMTAAGPALLKLKRSEPMPLAAESAATAPTGDFPLNRQPLRWQLVPYPGQRVLPKRSRRSQRRLFISPIGRGGRRWSGHNLTQLARRRGPCTALPTAASAIQPPSAADGIRSSVSDDLRIPNKPGRCCCRCRSDGQSERTRDTEKLNVLLSKIVDDKTPHTPDTNFYVVSRTRGLRFWPGWRQRAKDRGTCRITNDELTSTSL